MRRVLTLCAVLVVTALPACAAKSGTKVTCQSAEVAPSNQPGSPTPRKALDSYIKAFAKQHDLPSSGYRLESNKKTRYIYVSGNARVSVSRLPLAKPSDPKIWVVLQYFVC